MNIARNIKGPMVAIAIVMGLIASVLLIGLMPVPPPVPPPVPVGPDQEKEAPRTERLIVGPYEDWQYTSGSWEGFPPYVIIGGSDDQAVIGPPPAGNLTDGDVGARKTYVFTSQADLTESSMSALRNSSALTGWCWAIGVEADGLAASDVWVHSQGSPSDHTVRWENQSSPDRLVGLTMDSPLDLLDDNSNVAAHLQGWVQFNRTGTYKLVFWIVSISDVSRSPSGVEWAKGTGPATEMEVTVTDQGATAQETSFQDITAIVPQDDPADYSQPIGESNVTDAVEGSSEGTSGESRSLIFASSPSSVTISMTWRYKNFLLSSPQPCQEAYVELWKRTADGHDVVQSKFTDRSGRVTFDPVANGVYSVVIWADDQKAVKIDDGWNGNTFHWWNGWNQVSSNVQWSRDLGFWDFTRGAWACYDNVRDGYAWLHGQTKWSAEQVTVHWAWGDNDGRLGVGDITPRPIDGEIFIPRTPLVRASIWERGTMLHLYAHAIDHSIRGDVPIRDDITTLIEPNMRAMTDPWTSMSEGWAWFFECAVDNNTMPRQLAIMNTLWTMYSMYKMASAALSGNIVGFAGGLLGFLEHLGNYADIESDAGAGGWLSLTSLGYWDGYMYEGSVAMILWDLYDGVNPDDTAKGDLSGYGDLVDRRFADFWRIFTTYKPMTILAVGGVWTPQDASIWSVFHNARINLDETAPTNPTKYTSDHIVNVPSSNNLVKVNWSGAADRLSGVNGYAVSWSHSSLGTPSQKVNTTTNGTVSFNLADGSWYLHVRAVDRAGNWATGAFNIGPFVIGPEAPTPPSRLFDQPTIVVNQSVQASSSYGINGTTWRDDHTTATDLKVGEHYWYELDANATAAARQTLLSDRSHTGWVWYIEVDKQGINATDVSAAYLTYYEVYGGEVTIRWNDTQPDRLVGLGMIEPARNPAGGTPLYFGAENYTHASMQGWIAFNQPGDYVIKVYLSEVVVDGQYLGGGVPPVDGTNASEVVTLPLSVKTS